MGIRINDVECLAITDLNGEILIQSSLNVEASKLMCKSVSKMVDEITIVEDKIVLLSRMEEIIVIMYGGLNCNEVLLSSYLTTFTDSLLHILKKGTKEAMLKKYDQVCLLLSGFIYKGIVIENDSANLLKKVPIRSFEGLESMQIPEGFLSFLNQAKKTIKKSTR